MLTLHPTQKQILQNLSKAESLKFNQIKTFEIDPKSFVYHLNKLQQKGFVDLNPNKAYFLTTQGKIYIDTLADKTSITQIPISVFIGLFLIQDNRILTVKRTSAPYIDHIGIPTFNVKKSEFIKTTAQKEFQNLCLDGKLEHKLIIETIFTDKDDNSLTHSNMHVFFCSKTIGQQPKINSEGTLSWLSATELLATKNGYQDSRTMIEFFTTRPIGNGIQIISKKDSSTEF